MKKIIGLALALAAAALVFVGCSDEAGGDSVETSGTKWNKTIKVKSGDLDPSDAKYRRAWVQLGDNEKTAGIITTITVKKEDLVSSTGNSGVVGFMFDYNNHINADGNEDNDKRDFGLIGLSFSRKDGTKAGYYVVKNVGVNYKGSLDTTSDDLVRDSTDAKGTLLTGDYKNVDKLDRDWYLNNDHIAWVNVDKEKLYKEVRWDDKSTFNDAYQVVIRISPTITTGALDGNGYDIFIGPDTESVNTNATAVATYKPEAAHKVAGHKLSVKVGKTEKDIPCGGVAMYLNAKTENFAEGNTFTKIEARYTTVTTTKNNNNSFATITELQSASVVGDLKIANTSNDNSTVIVE